MISEIHQENAVISFEQWATVQRLYKAHLEGRGLDPTGLWPGRLPLSSRSEDTLILNIQGYLTKLVDPFLQSIGAMSTEVIKNCITQGIKTKGVTKIVLNINSPGSGPGVQSLANYIFYLRNIIPIDCICDGEMLSGAYWIGAATRHIYSACETVKIGSIGVVVSSQRKEQAHNLIIARKGKYKAQNLGQTSLSDEERRNLMEEQATYIYDAFTRDIARFRNLPLSDVQAMEGITYLGENAIRAGLVDGFYDLVAWNLFNKVREKEEGHGARLRSDFLNSIISKGEK